MFFGMVMRSNMFHNSQEKKSKKKQRRRSKHAKFDRISTLPEHLIDDILSHMSIRDAVSTSILSRSWRYKWTTVPSLVFDEECFPDSTDGVNKLVRVINYVLLHHKGSIRKFKLAHPDIEDAADIDSWILFVSETFIEELILEICWEGERYKPPSCLFNCQNLTRLELYNCTVKPPPTFKGFKNLRILDLEEISIDQDVFENFICFCPLLEELVLIDIDGLTVLNINAPNLKIFDAGGVFHNVSFKNTFKLESVTISFDEEIKHIHDEPETDESSSEISIFFANLLHIRKLKICYYFLEYLGRGNIPRSLPNQCLDLNYLTIETDFNYLANTKATLCLLRSFPNLQELEMKSWTKEQPDAGTYINLWGDDLWSSLFTHLRVLTVEGISGFRSELDFIRFILSNAPALERMKVKHFPLDGSLGSLGLGKELLRFKRASLDLEIIMEDPDPE